MPCTPSNFPANAELKYVRINATADNDNTVISAPAGKKKIIVLGYVINANAAGVVSFQNSAEEAVTYASYELTDGGSISYAGSPWAPAFEVAAGTGLEVKNAAGVDALGHLVYVIA